MQIEAIDHVHFCVPDLEKAMNLFKVLVGGEFGEMYGGEAVNARGVWNTIGLDLIQPIRDAEPVFGGSGILRKGIVGVSFRVHDIDARIPEVQAFGLHLVSRVSSEDVGFGKLIVQAQFHPANSFGATVELCEYVLPGYVHEAPFRHIIDHVELYARDLERATKLFADLTGAGFPPAETLDEIKAKAATHPLGLKVTQPTSPASPIARTIAEKGEGFHAIAFRAANLEESIARARSAGLKMVRQTGGGGAPRQVEFHPGDSFGVTMKFVECP